MQIDNLDIYTTRMQSSLNDKLYFLEYLPDSIHTIVDFGCADGSLLGEVKRLRPNIRCIGIDNSDDMLNIMKQKYPDVEGIHSYYELGEIQKGTALILSSVIHEVYSYCEKEDIYYFWKFVLKSGFDYICIRDMAMTNEAAQKALTKKDKNKILLSDEYNSQLLQYESIWGRMRTKKDLVHFLLKYRYKENWKREVREDYLPLSVEELIDKVTGKYKIHMFSHYVLPYTQRQVQEDFGIIMDAPTHVKIILKR